MLASVYELGAEGEKLMCEWGHGLCTAPNTDCPHWIGTYCELDKSFYEFENVHDQPKDEA